MGEFGGPGMGEALKPLLDRLDLFTQPQTVELAPLAPTEALSDQELKRIRALFLDEVRKAIGEGLPLGKALDAANRSRKKLHEAQVDLMNDWMSGHKPELQAGAVQLASLMTKPEILHPGLRLASSRSVVNLLPKLAEGIVAQDNTLGYWRTDFERATRLLTFLDKTAHAASKGIVKADDVSNLFNGLAHATEVTAGGVVLASHNLVNLTEEELKAAVHHFQVPSTSPIGTHVDQVLKVGLQPNRDSLVFDEVPRPNGKPRPQGIDVPLLPTLLTFHTPSSTSL